VTVALPLDINGVVIPGTSLPGAAIWLEFDVYPAVAFSVFNLE